MTFSGVCKISILAHRQQIFAAPLLFLWIIIIHYILGVTVAPVTMLLTGATITVYQQFNTYVEDVADGFFDHCRYNSLHPLTYAWAKSVSIWIGTLLPMAFILLIVGIGFTQSLLIFSQWVTLSICIACALSFMPDSSPLNLLLAWTPLLTAPLIFSMDFLNTFNGNSLLILLGCDIILVSTICVPLTFHKS
jgi:hypothetical protein